MSLTTKRLNPRFPVEYTAWWQPAGCWIFRCLHSLELALDAECYFVGSLQDLLQAHDVVGVWVPEGDLVWKATNLDGLWTASDQLVGDDGGAVQSQSLAWTHRTATWSHTHAHTRARTHTHTHTQTLSFLISCRDANSTTDAACFSDYKRLLNTYKYSHTGNKVWRHDWWNFIGSERVSFQQTAS